MPRETGIVVGSDFYRLGCGLVLWRRRVELVRRDLRRGGRESVRVYRLRLGCLVIHVVG